MVRPAVIRARWVLPIDAEPIQNGEVVVENDQIVEVRPVSSLPDSEVRNLGDAILIPGLVNTHAHLEYSFLRGYDEKTPLFPWIRHLVTLKAQVPQDHWLPSAMMGAAELLASGVTFVADNSDTGVTAEAIARSGLRGRVYQEFFGIGEEASDEAILNRLSEQLETHQTTIQRFGAEGRVETGISPHAIYTVRDSLMKQIGGWAAQRDLPLSLHASESYSEVALTRAGSGEFAQMFNERKIPYASPRVQPIEYLASTGVLGQKTQLVHCVRVEPLEIDLMAKFQCAVAHCPRSNAKLLSGIAPIQEILRTGIPVGLGTDSAVSSGSLDFFEEIRCAAWLQRSTRHTPKPTAKEWIEIATLGGARAMGLDSQIGSLTPGKKADLCAIRISRAAFGSAPDPFTALVFAAQAPDVILTMVNGQTLYEEGKWLTLEMDKLRAFPWQTPAEAFAD